jgi:hypothetical protein
VNRPAAVSDLATTIPRAGLVLGWLAALIVCGWLEGVRILQLAETPAGPLAWFATWNHDTSLPLLVLVALPPLLLISRRSSSRTGTGARAAAQPEPAQPRPKLPTLLVGLLALIANASIGFRSIEVPATGPLPSRESSTVAFHSLPPAYHDEFSYLLQARSFLAGRVSWPAMTVGGDAFHQIHVLNRPVTASRYFPWTGAWMAPFLAVGMPVLGHWFAGALAAAVFHRVLQRLVPAGVAFSGGLLLAASPGLAVFSNLLLAHHPTLLALAVFLYAFQNLQITGRRGWAWLAGTALTCGMLGRPMTAAGFAAPFGFWLLIDWLHRFLHSNPQDCRSCLRQILFTAAGFAIPLAAGFLVLALLNLRITGHWNESPYQLYTDTWTPRHRFGFQNALQPAQPENVLARYDAWAENLTPRRALQNVHHRLLASSQWTLGLAALLALLPASCGLLLRREPSPGRTLLRLIAASVISLHLVHVPYWYDGILHWHYVFETAPLLLLLAAAGLDAWQRGLQRFCGARLARRWLMALLLSALAPAWIDSDVFWGPSRVSLAVSEQAWSRGRMEAFQRTAKAVSGGRPCLILVDERNGDQQLSYVVNPPDYSGPVLVARLPKTVPELAELQQHFRDRTAWIFQPETFRFTRGFPAGSDLRSSDR